MSHQGLIPDPFRFAAEGRSLSGTLSLKRLERLADLLAEQEGEISFALESEIGGDGKPYLRLAAEGVLKLQCQRCLGVMDWPLRVDSLLQIVPIGTPIPEEELEVEDFDTIEAGPDFDVRGLVEDEIVLAVPIAPRHENCDALLRAGASEKESPFASLAKLRKSSE